MDSTRSLAKLGVVIGAALGLSALPPGPAPAADFIRGDVNGDGVVSLADSHFLLRALSYFGPRPECLKAADADHNEQVDGADARRIFLSLFDGDAPLPAPYPAPGPAGPDEGMEGWLDCDAYGNGEPLEDPVAELEITDSVAPGGASNLATVVISLSSSRPLAGFSGTVSIDPRILGPTKPQEGLPLSFALDSSDYNSARAKDGLLTFGFLNVGVPGSPPRRNVTACEITFCLKEGTKAGSYPIELVAGELVDEETGRSIRPPLAGGTLTVESDVAPGQGCSSDPSAVQFLRGDANGDRRVSIADVHALALGLFDERVPLECLLSGDIDNDAFIGIHDVIRASSQALFGHDSLPSPFPQPGPDDGNNDQFGYGSYPCDSYGGGSALEDPEAQIAVLDAVAQGGFESGVKIRIAFSSSNPIAGLSGAIRSDPGVLASTVTLLAESLAGPPSGFAPGATSRTAGGRLAFALALDPTGYESIPAGKDVEVVEVTACISPGTPAGDYALSLAEGELADAETGRAISPVLRSGTLRLLSDVRPGTGCDSGAGMPPPRWKVPNPETINARFELGDAVAAPGSEAAVSFRMRADAVIQGFSFSVDFDEDVLECTGIDPLFELGTHGFMGFDFNNERRTAGSAGVDEGYAVGGVSLGGTSERYLPPNEDHDVLRLRFRIREDVTEVSTELRFLDGGKGNSGIVGVVPNSVVAHRQNYYPETASSFIFANGRVNVLPDISTFIRGDSNGDAKVDISDPIATLGFLFLGGLRPACYDAADTTDDGQVDLADSIFALNHLFAGDPVPVPAPYPDPGEDPTSDGLGCLYRS